MERAMMRWYISFPGLPYTLPQIWWLKTTEIYPLAVWRLETLIQTVSRPMLSLKAPKGKSDCCPS